MVKTVFSWVLFLTLVLLSANAFAQPRIGIEFAGGVGLGFNPYVDNVVILDSDVPVLVDEIPGPGVHFQVRFLFSELELFGGLNLFNRNVVVQHHRATGTISPRNRLRPDGTIDDSGVEYEAVEETRVSTNENKGDMMFIRLGGGYRFYLLEDAFRLYVPVSGGITFISILEPSRPTKTGAFVESGLGVAVDVAKPISFFFDARITGAATSSYAPISDAARTSFLNNETTESTIFSSFISASFLLGFQVAIR